MSYRSSFSSECKFRTVKNLSRLIGSLKYKKIELSCGSFSVNRKNYDVQNITNIVSLYFYDSAKIPDNVRKEILEKTVPKVKDLRRSLIK